MSTLSHLVSLLICGGMAACATHDTRSLRASWYLRDDVPPTMRNSAPDKQAVAAQPGKEPLPPPPTIYLALLNTGARDYPLKSISINTASINSSSSLTLPPGRLQVLNATRALGPCRLPVFLTLTDEAGHTSTLPVSSPMPNYLHDAWLMCCARPSTPSEPPCPTMPAN